jgi:hypothetical protein
MEWYLPGYTFGLQANLTSGAEILEARPGTWRLQIPAGPSGRYRLAQLDDYRDLRREAFRWEPPVRLLLRARAGAGLLPGTWGFGLWNDPFSMGVLSGGRGLRWPALPNTAWFFFASPPGYLSLRDDLPAQGMLAATFCSPSWPAALTLLGALALPLLALPPLVRLFRRLARRLVQQEAVELCIDLSAWHQYELEWRENMARFVVDGVPVLQTPVSPRGRLGLVMWLDNQYLALPPDGRLRYGWLENPIPAWIEIEKFTVEGIDLAENPTGSS